MAQSNWEADKMYVHSEFCFSGFQLSVAVLNLLNLCPFFFVGFPFLVVGLMFTFMIIC